MKVARWLVAGPPLVAGAILAADAVQRWRVYDDAMRAGRKLPAARGLAAISIGVSVYGVVALLAIVIDA